jgi:peptidoglycan/LPS O-acetylase OafA/YrhL
MDAKTRRLVDIPSLDGLRAVSIAIVFVAHAGYEIVPGGLGVTIFFVISGFLITTLLRIEMEAKRTVSVHDFYLRRVFRILPLFYGVLILGLIGMRIGLGDGHVDVGATASQFGHFFNIFAITHSGYSIIPGSGIYWSLAIEEHFYLFFPVLILLFCRLKLSPFRQGVILLVGCAVVLIWRSYLVYGLHVDTNRTYYGTDTRIDSLLFGCAAALMLSPVLDRDRTWTRPNKWFGLAAFACLGATLLVRGDAFRESSRYTIQSIAIVVCMLYAITAIGSPTFRALNWKPIAWFGRMSFAFYLVHQIVIGELQKHISSKPVVLVIALGLSTLLAWLLHLAIERPAARLRSRFVQSKTRAPAPAGPAAGPPSTLPAPAPLSIPYPLPPPISVAADSAAGA